MEEIKRMLEVIHNENKDIMIALFMMNEKCNSDEHFKEIYNKVDEYYDSLFYEKEEEATNKYDDAVEAQKKGI